MASQLLGRTQIEVSGHFFWQNERAWMKNSSSLHGASQMAGAGVTWISPSEQVKQLSSVMSEQVSHVGWQSLQSLAFPGVISKANCWSSQDVPQTSGDWVLINPLSWQAVHSAAVEHVLHNGSHSLQIFRPWVVSECGSKKKFDPHWVAHLKGTKVSMKAVSAQTEQDVKDEHSLHSIGQSRQIGAFPTPVFSSNCPNEQAEPHTKGVSVKTKWSAAHSMQLFDDPLQVLHFVSHTKHY